MSIEPLSLSDRFNYIFHVIMLLSFNYWENNVSHQLALDCFHTSCLTCRSHRKCVFSFSFLWFKASRDNDLSYFCYWLHVLLVCLCVSVCKQVALSNNLVKNSPFVFDFFRFKSLSVMVGWESIKILRASVWSLAHRWGQLNNTNTFYLQAPFTALKVTLQGTDRNWKKKTMYQKDQ